MCCPDDAAMNLAHLFTNLNSLVLWWHAFMQCNSPVPGRIWEIACACVYLVFMFIFICYVMFLIFPGALEACTWCSGACLLGERHKLRQSRLCHQLITPDHGATSLYNFHMLPSLFTWKIFLPPFILQFDRAGAGALGCSWPVHAWSKTCLKRFSSLWSWSL